MKKILSLVFGLLLCVSMAGVAACGGGSNEDAEHEHKYSDRWTVTSMQHYKIATCGHATLKEEAGVHADEDADGACDVCNYSMGNSEVVEHKHTYSSAWATNQDSHWHPATCGHDLKQYEGTHQYGDDNICDTCSYVKPSGTGHECTFADTWSSDETVHWHAATCSHKDYKKDVAAHIWNDGVITTPPTTTKDGVKTYTCTACEYKKTETVPALEATEHLAFNLVGDNYEVVGIGNVAATEIVIPDEYNGKPVTAIADNAFFDCDHITSVTIGKNIVDIGAEAFHRCISLTTVNFSASVKNIGENAFYGCVKLNNVVFGQGVESVQSGAFSYCSALQNISINANIKYFGENVFYASDRISYYDDGTNALYLGDNSSACIVLIKAYNTAVTNIVVNPETKVIAAKAFESCSSLENVTMSEGLLSIGSYAFFGCSSLTDVTIPDSVTSIGDSAFYGCSKITDLVVGGGVQSIGADAFQNCSALATVKFHSGLEAWANVDFGNEYANPAAVAGALQVYISNAYATVSQPSISEATVVKAYAFYNLPITAVTLGNSVQAVADYAFGACESLETVTVGSGIKTIASTAFEGCTALTYNVSENGNYFGDSTNQYRILVSVVDADATTFVINASTTAIADGAFIDCSELTSITIPENVTSIGATAFYLAGSAELNVSFANVNGWSAGGVQFSNTDLATTTITRLYLTDLYAFDAWTRG